MSHYHIHIRCTDCAEIHPMGVTIRLPHGPDKATNLDELYAGSVLPAELAVFTNSRIRCLVTGNWSNEVDRKRVYLVPINT